jgi:hypothetical protein
MTRSLVEKYRMGMITDDHFLVEILHLVDPENPGLVLSSLPDKLLHRMLQFAKVYQQSRMVTNYGVLPAQDQVRAASHWIETLLRQQAGKMS